jgi:hypothetical protein
MTKAWLVLVGWCTAGCAGGTTAGASGIAGLYDETSTDALGARALYSVDTASAESEVDLELREHARLGVRGLMRFDGEHRTCTLGERWREVDERRLGFTLHCSDGIDREAIFVADDGSRLFHPPAIEGTFLTPVKLESVGSDVAEDGAEAPPHWSWYRFAIVRP